VAHFHYVLSMGAVFGLFTAWYSWSPKIIGLMYNLPLGKLHFFSFFFGANITFFPSTFLRSTGNAEKDKWLPWCLLRLKLSK
jgi:cytochrome c oxidase subunit 1